MTGLVIGASADSVYAIQVAKKMGIRTVAIDGDLSAKGLEHADEKHIIDISDIEKVKAFVKEIQPDFLIPIPIGKLLSVAGEINEKFNLPGVKSLGGVFSTDKYQFHMRLKENQLRNCECILVNSTNKEVNYNGKYPAIIKPRYGSGSRDVYFLNSEQELKNVLKKIRNNNEDFILEEVEEGEEFGVDAAVIDGKFQLILLRKKIITPPPIRQAIGSVSIVDNIEILNCVELFLQKVVTCMELNQCLLNADIIINKNGIFPIEVSARPSGHNLHSVFVPMVTGVDMIGEYIKYLKEENNYSFIPKKNKRLMIRYFNLENCEIRYVPTEQELEEKGFTLLKWKCNINVGDRMEKVVDGHSIMGRGYFVIEGESEDDLNQQAESILALFKTKK